MSSSLASNSLLESAPADLPGDATETREFPPGATICAEGVHYSVWAASVQSIEVVIEAENGGRRTLQLERDALGYHRALDPAGRAGDAYFLRLEGNEMVPDPASRAQRDGVHGASLVIDPQRYRWRDQDWVRPSFRDVVLYEVHIGAFTPAGTFRAAIEKLPQLRELGVNALEILPIADFPGERNWGYDGVLIYAPARDYGSPDDLRALVDAAHALGIAVVLDVVYNHLGPDGNYLPRLSDAYFNARHHTPWGRGFNWDSDNSAPVREFFLHNLEYWMDEFHLDGFRLDATHEIADDSRPHILAEMAELIHARGGYAMAEDARNERRMLLEAAEDGCAFDAVWADDFHHIARVSQTGEQDAYFADFAGSMEEMIDVLQHGWRFRGAKSPSSGKVRGTACADLPPTGFIHCISNHDQTGNRALGDRLHAVTSPEGYRALSALLCLTPYTPLLFMGQEWAATAPFQFFTDHNAELGPLVTEGRRREFSEFGEFKTDAAQSEIPDPQEAATFLRSKLDWAEATAPGHVEFLQLYRECLRLRNATPALRPAGRENWSAFRLGENVGAIRFTNGSETMLIAFTLKGTEPTRLPDDARWELQLSSNEARFGGAGPGFDAAAQTVQSATPEVLLLRANSPR